MRVEYKNGEELEVKNIKEVESGTLVLYGSKSSVYGKGIVLKDSDNCNTIVFDLEDNCYYEDGENYYVWQIFDSNNVKIVVE